MVPEPTLVATVEHDSLLEITMSKVRIGGVTVANGGNVKWGLLTSIIIGTPMYAYFEGIIGLVVGFREFLIDGLLGGVRSWLVTLINLEFTVAEVAVDTAWWEFWSSVQSYGVLAWLLSVLAAALVFLLVALLFRKGVSALVG